MRTAVLVFGLLAAVPLLVSSDWLIASLFVLGALLVLRWPLFALFSFAGAAFFALMGALGSEESLKAWALVGGVLALVSWFTESDKRGRLEPGNLG